MKRIGIFLVAVTLIAGLTGCDNNGGESYTLTISSTIGGSVTISSTIGGNVTIPGEGTYNYPAGVAVVLMAEPDEGYGFAYWSGDVSTIIDVNAATTILAMNGDYSITANFVQGRAIRTWYDLDEIRYYPSGDWVLVNNLDYTTSGYAQLAGSLANDGKGWSPIGTVVNFSGTFDGQGYEICDLFISNSNCGEKLGLFSLVGEGAVIKNVGMINADVNAPCGGTVGILVAENNGAVYNSYSTGNSVNAFSSRNLGGLVGKNRGIVCNSYSTYSVSVSNQYVGGLVGINYGTVNNSYSTGNVSGNSEVGGLVGFNGGTINNSYSTGSVSGVYYVGGLVGWPSDSTATNSFWDTETSGQATSHGGTGKNTTEMHDFSTFFNVGWNITAITNPSTRNTSYLWNIVDDETYPFLSWE